MSDDIMRDVLNSMDADTVKPYADVRPLMKALTNVGQVEFITGIAGTGALLDVETQGDPRGVILFNRTQNAMAFHIKGMPAASAMKVVAAAAWTAADCITLGDEKFTIGVDADLNTLADDIDALVII